MTPYARLMALCPRWTGKTVDNDRRTWYQTAESIIVPSNDEEGLLHEIAHWVVASRAEREHSNLMLEDHEDDVAEAPPWWSFRLVERREFEAVRLEEAIYRAAGRDIPGYAANTWSFRTRFESKPPRVQRSIDRAWRRRLADHPGMFEGLVDAVRLRPTDSPNPYYTMLSRHVEPPEPGWILASVRWKWRCLHCDHETSDPLCHAIPRHGGGYFHCKSCGGELIYHPIWMGEDVAGVVSLADGSVNVSYQRLSELAGGTKPRPEA